MNNYVLCPYFEACNGCQHQNLPYTEELAIKETQLKQLFWDELQCSPDIFRPLVASPQEYHYRHRIDLTAIKTRAGSLHIGFNPPNNPILEVEQCAIAMQPLSKFIPELRKTLHNTWRDDYKRANITLKTDETGRIFWGGMGKGSLKQEPKDYLHVTLNGRKIYLCFRYFFSSQLKYTSCFAKRI